MPLILKITQMNDKKIKQLSKQSLLTKVGCVLFILHFPLSLNAQLLWRIDGNGLAQASYLFGTHHLIPAEFLENVPGVFQAFRATETVIGEMVLYNIEASEKIMQASRLPVGITMESLLSADDWAIVDLELQRTLRMGLRELALLRPNMINTLYTIELFGQFTDAAGDIKLDSYFQILAIQENKRILGLETVEQQLEALFGSSLQREAEMLVKTVQMREEVIAGIKELNRLYKAGEIEKLYQFSQNSNSPTAFTAEEAARLNSDRNQRWAQILPDLMRESPSFIAVGALHLGGEQGLINLLRQQGFRVSPVGEETPRRRSRR